VRQDVEQDCSKDEINDNFSDCAHESPPDFDNDNRQHNGDQHGHPVDRTEIKLHRFLLFYLAKGIESPYYRNADHQDGSHSLRCTSTRGNRR
jgi:hypothetical protein